MTECRTGQLEFQGIGGRAVVGNFDAGRATSDGGVLLLREVAERTGLIREFAGCFTDHRKPELIEHRWRSWWGSGFWPSPGLRRPQRSRRASRRPAFAVAAGKVDATGSKRAAKQDRGQALAGKSTLNRLELTPEGASAKARYKKIVYDARAIEEFFVEAFLDAHREAPEEIVLDLDATDDPLHGQQLGRFFHGYYGATATCRCTFSAATFAVCAVAAGGHRRAAGAVEQLERIVAGIRARWPEVRIIVRGDTGFAARN